MERCYLGIVVGRRSRTLQNVGGPWIPTDQRSLCPSIVELIDRTAILSLCYVCPVVGLTRGNLKADPVISAQGC